MTDLISKSELKEWVENWFNMNRCYHPYAKKNDIPICELYDILQRMPTVEEKRGKWLKTGQSFVYPDKFRNYFCSVCGFELDTHIRQEPNYCPNCGARMERSEE